MSSTLSSVVVQRVCYVDVKYLEKLIWLDGCQMSVCRTLLICSCNTSRTDLYVLDSCWSTFIYIYMVNFPYSLGVITPSSNQARILRPCLVHPKIQKVFKIPCHIESCGICMKH